MSLFGNLKSEGLEESQDRIGGFQPLETDIYTGVIKAMYAGKSAGGATSVSIILDTNGKEYRETFYVTNKKGENFFLNKDDKTKKVPLPGFTLVDDICMVTSGKPLSEQNTEEKVIKLYDFDARKELPKGVQMLVDCIGLEVSLGILKELHNKNEKSGDEYVATAEVIERNATDKVFHTETHMTVAEARSGAEKAQFWESWTERNKGNVRDRRTIKDGQAGKPVGGPPKAGGSKEAPRKSLFGNKK